MNIFRSSKNRRVTYKMSCAPKSAEVDADVVIVPLNKLALLTSFCHDRLASCFFLFFPIALPILFL